MVNYQLVDWIRQNQANGYDINSLRDSLLQGGYPQNDVDEAIKSVVTPAPSTPTSLAPIGGEKKKDDDEKKRKKLIFWIVASIAAILLVLLLLILLWPSNPKPAPELAPSVTANIIKEFTPDNLTVRTVVISKADRFNPCVSNDPMDPRNFLCGKSKATLTAGVKTDIDVKNNAAYSLVQLRGDISIADEKTYPTYEPFEVTKLDSDIPAYIVNDISYFKMINMSEFFKDNQELVKILNDMGPSNPLAKFEGKWISNPVDKGKAVGALTADKVKEMEDSGIPSLGGKISKVSQDYLTKEHLKIVSQNATYLKVALDADNYDPQGLMALAFEKVKESMNSSKEMQTIIDAMKNANDLILNNPKYELIKNKAFVTNNEYFADPVSGRIMKVVTRIEFNYNKDTIVARDPKDTLDWYSNIGADGISEITGLNNMQTSISLPAEAQSAITMAEFNAAIQEEMQKSLGSIGNLPDFGNIPSGSS